MNFLERNQVITPHKISLCILLHEVLLNAQLPQPGLIKVLHFLTDQIVLANEELPLAELLERLREFDEPDYSISERLFLALDSISNYTDLLSLFLVKLEELKSDGDLPSTLLDQGGALFGFIIKIFITFNRMGFEDLTRLETKLQLYKQGKSLESVPSVRYLANSLNSLLCSMTYDELTSLVSSLPGGEKYIILSHIDAVYGKNTAVDHAHRYFDTVLDKFMPTKKTKERGLVIVYSSTHFASLHRVKVELEIGHLDVAVHLLVETIKRALSENDNLAILESILLFMQIAAILGNSRQEERIAVKAVLHALQMGSPLGLIKSCLAYMNLELIYKLPQSPQILKVLVPASPPKKPNMVQKRVLTLPQDVRTSINLGSHTLVDAVKNQKFDQFFPKLLEIKTLLWQERSPWLYNSYLGLLRQTNAKGIHQYPDCNFYLKLVRLQALHDKATALSLLQEIDAACAVKEPTDWYFTVAYLNAVWGTHSGEFQEAEYFERQAARSVKPLSEHEWTIMIHLAKGERLVFQREFAQAHTLLVGLVQECKERNLAQETVLALLLLASVYTGIHEYIQAYSLLQEASELSDKDSNNYFLAITQLSEALLDIYPHSSACLDQLASIEVSLSLSKSSYVHGRFHYVKALGLLAIAESLPKEVCDRILQKAVSHCEKAVASFKDLQFIWEQRQCYYLLARAFDTFKAIPERDQAATEFCRLNKALNLGGKRQTAIASGLLSLQQTLIA